MLLQALVVDHEVSQPKYAVRMYIQLILILQESFIVKVLSVWPQDPIIDQIRSDDYDDSNRQTHKGEILHNRMYHCY